MREYTGFAEIYDLLMDEVPYDTWAEYILGLFREYGITGDNKALSASMTGSCPIVADLGCGTGNMTRRLKAAGLDMIGIDLSPEMLGIARDKEADPCADDAILYLCQDMREFELYGTVAAVVSLCDSMNYLTDEEDMSETLARVANYLDPAGVFIFDLHTEFYYKKVLGDSTFYEERETAGIVWENAYDPEERLNEYDLTIYMKEGQADEQGAAEAGTCGRDAESAERSDAAESADRSEAAESAGRGEETESAERSERERDECVYRRFTETHVQRAWRPAEIKKLLRKAGLETLAVYGECSHDEPASDEERIYFVARKIK